MHVDLGTLAEGGPLIAIVFLIAAIIQGHLAWLRRDILSFKSDVARE
jgi:hypothetical protein